MPEGNGAGRLSRGLELIGGGWVDRYVPEAPATMQEEEEETRGFQTKSVKVTKKKKKGTKKANKPDRSVVSLVIGAVLVIVALMWAFLIVSVAAGQLSVTGDTLRYALEITATTVIAMLAVAGQRVEFLKLS